MSPKSDAKCIVLSRDRDEKIKRSIFVKQNVLIQCFLVLLNRPETFEKTTKNKEKRNQKKREKTNKSKFKLYVRYREIVKCFIDKVLK